MRNLFFILLLFFVVVLVTVPAIAQNTPFKTYSIEQGLSESVAHDLIQDGKGYIWIATGYGLNKFDGISFRIFYQRDGLNSNEINTLFEDKDGSLWIGTGSGVNLMVHDSISAPVVLEPLRSKFITHFFRDSRGDLWISTDDSGVWVLSADQNELIQYTKNNGLADNDVRDMIETEDGSIWFATSDGITILKDGNFDRFEFDEKLPSPKVRSLNKDETGNILIGTRRGLAVYKNDSLAIYNIDHGLVSNRIQAILPHKSQGAWIGTEEGAAYFDGSGFVNHPFQRGTSGTFVYSVMKDREENIWFGTLGGGIKMYLGNHFSNYTFENGLPNNIVTGFEEERNGDIWIATYGGGITKKSGNRFSYLTQEAGLADDKVYSLFKDSRDRLWVGTRNGINLIENQRISELPDTLATIRMARDFYEDPQSGEIWIATYQDGIFVTDGQQIVNHFTENNGIPSNTVMQIARDEDGIFWFATYGGVSTYDGQNFKNYTVVNGLPGNGVIHVMIDYNGEKWFSTFNGIAKFNDGNILSFSRYGGNRQTIAYFMFQDSYENYWIGTNVGLFKLKPDEYLNSVSLGEAIKTVRAFTTNQGLVSNEMNAGASFVTSDGNIWLGTVEGASLFFPEQVDSAEVPPAIHLDNILVSGEQVPENVNEFDYNSNFIEFAFTGLSFSGPDQIYYEYRLRGLSEKWQVTTDRNVRFASLQAGDYEFQVRAYNHAGLLSSDFATYRFSILPPFWMAGWFLLLIFFIAGALVFAIYQFWKTRKMVEIERMRVQIASDLHDDVGSSLTELALQTDFLQTGNISEKVKETLNQIGDQSRKIVSSLDDIVWSIDARNDTAGDLTDRMQDYANNILCKKNIEIKYDFDELDMDRKLPVQVKENIYLIFKEAINNIYKHSNADKVSVRFKFENSSIRLEIHDNGSISTNNRKTGHGLRNINMRAERIGVNARFLNSDGFKVLVSGNLN